MKALKNDIRLLEETIKANYQPNTGLIKAIICGLESLFGIICSAIPEKDAKAKQIICDIEKALKSACDEME